MIFRTHIAFALLVGLLFVENFKGNSILFLIIVLFFTMLPDIDHPKSKLGRKIPFVSKIFSFLFGHRNLLHSIFIAIGLSFLIYSFFGKWWAPVFLGYFSHILIDGFTLEGINFIYPFKQLRLQGFVEVGGKQEILIFWFLVFIDSLLFYRVFF
jgi:inner membrane protein